MNIFRFSMGSEAKEWLFDVSLLLGSYAGLILVFSIWIGGHVSAPEALCCPLAISNH